MNFYENLTIELIKFTPTILIASITLYIAFRQHQIEKVRLDKELFEKRSEIYKIIYQAEFLLNVKKNVEMSLLEKLTFGITDRYFLFSDSLNEILEEWTMNVWRLSELELGNKKEESNILKLKIINDLIDIKKRIQNETAIRYKKSER